MAFIYPTNFELSQIEPDLVARGAAGRRGPGDHARPRSQRGRSPLDPAGQLLRPPGPARLDGAPTRVQRAGEKVYTYEPGVFGEYVDITETELTRRAGYSPAGTPIDVSDLVVNADQQLINREFDRIERPSGRCSPPAPSASSWMARTERRSASPTPSASRRTAHRWRGRRRRRPRPSPTSRPCSSSAWPRGTALTSAPVRWRT
jgi:hypothetical protein